MKVKIEMLFFAGAVIIAAFVIAVIGCASKSGTETSKAPASTAPPAIVKEPLTPPKPSGPTEPTRPELPAGKVPLVASVLDGPTVTVEKIAPMSVAHNSGGAVVWNGKYFIWAGTGEPSGHPLSLEIYNPATGEWKRGADCPSGRNGMGEFELGGKLYSVGGEGPGYGSFSSSVFRYDPETDRWETLHDFPVRAWDVLCVAFEGKAYAFGGRRGYGGTCGDTFEYDPKNDTWTRRADMPHSVMQAGAIALDGKVYVFGGTHKEREAGQVWAKKVQVYDPKADAWTVAGDMPWLLSQVSAVTVGRTLYIFSTCFQDEKENPLGRYLIKYTPDDGKWVRYPFVTPTTIVTNTSVCVIDGYAYFTNTVDEKPAPINAAFRMKLPK
jgi:N-acetylneuraminic acid mutarotase